MHSKIIILIVFIVLVSCNRDQPEDGWLDDIASFQTSTDLIIGLEDQPFDNHLGEPVAVRTDETGDIYIADKASLTIKVFSESGEYLRSLGGRGRGPGEFHDINLMEFTDDGNILILDRGLLQFVYITKEGEHLSSHPVDLSGQLSQYYPTHVFFTGQFTLGLFLNGAIPDRSPMFQRELFHIYSRNFQTKQDSFFPFKELQIDDSFVWATFLWNSGSAAYSPGKAQFVYSPPVYMGNFYLFKMDEKTEKWSMNKKIKSLKNPVKPYRIFENETEYERYKNTPGTRNIHFGGRQHYGQLNYMDAGIHFLDDERFIQFFSNWQNDEPEPTENSNHFIADIYAQVMNLDGQTEHIGHVTSVTSSRQYFRQAPVNWKDNHDRFYTIDYSMGYPVVKRISIDLSGPGDVVEER